MHGPSNERTLRTRIIFGSLLNGVGEFVRGEEQARAVLGYEGSAYPPGSLLGVQARVQLTASLVGQERFEEALEFADAALEFSGNDAETRDRLETLRARALAELDGTAQAGPGE